MTTQTTPSHSANGQYAEVNSLHLSLERSATPRPDGVPMILLSAVVTPFPDAPSGASMPTFTATLKQEGQTATGIEVPPEIMNALGGGKKPAITVTLNAYTYRSTIGVMGGRSMIPVSAEHRGKAGLSAGDPVQVTLELDSAPRVVVVPGELQAALDANPAALAAFGKLSYSGKRLHTLSVDGTRNPQTRARRVAKAIETLSGCA